MARIYRSRFKQERLPPVDWIGGINLNPALLDLQIKRDGNGIPLPITQQPIGNMKIEGFIPVIINVTPVNLPLLLGVNEQKSSDSQPAQQSLTPSAKDSMDLSCFSSLPQFFDPKRRFGNKENFS